MTATTYSRGWATEVKLGEGQEHVRQVLAAAIRHPSRVWHDAPTMREYGRAPSTAHRLVHRLAALGVIAIQATLGAQGGVRYTFGVRPWRTHPVRLGQLRRWRPAAPGQLLAWKPPEDPDPDPGDTPSAAPRQGRMPWDRRPAPAVRPNPDGTRPTFGDMMRRYGYNRPERPAGRDE